MVGTGASGDSGSKEAVGMMALHEALRNVCLASDWTYSVFWTIRPRPRCRGGNGCKVGDDNGSLMLMWEDGFCRARVADCHDDFDGGEDPVRRAFSKMSIQLYNYGEGLMGKVASDKCHKWVFKEPSECEPNNISNYWQSSFDAIPPEWSDQFASGIQTIAVIQAGHGLLQLGSCKIIPEDLHFVLRMRHMFESLGYQSGFYLSQLFSSTRTTPPVTPSPIPKQLPARPLANWSHHRPLTSHAFVANQMGYRKEDSTHMFLPMAHQSSTQLESIVHDHDHDPDLKWPNGLSFFTALTGRVDESKLLFATSDEPHPLTLGGSSTKDKLDHDEGNARDDHVEEYLGLEGHPVGGGGKMGHNFKFKRSFTLPTRGSSSSSPSISSSSLNASYAPMQHSSSGGGGTGNGGGDGIYSDIMETFLE